MRYFNGVSEFVAQETVFCGIDMRLNTGMFVRFVTAKSSKKFGLTATSFVCSIF